MDKEYQGQIKLNSRVGYLSQFYNYQSGQTVEEFFIEVSYDYGGFLHLMKEFGFETEFLDRYITDCSGGEQTKLQIIRLLIEEPNLLIFDEPTNHLDLETRDWLAGFLQEFQGGVLLVSHDRYFLDQVVKEIWQFIKEIQEKNPEKSNQLIRTFLGSMLFRGEDVYKKIGNLSIGERVRIVLTIILLSDANFLLLDEPLNHLDIISRERIEAELNEYSGSFLIVTHDRYFARETVNEIWELSDKGLVIFQGNYDDFLKHKQGEFKTGQDLEDELLKMRRVELLTRLEKTRDKEEIERITAELDRL